MEYHAVDLAEGISGNILENVSAVIHCAAETSGGKIDHERNSVLATRRLLEDMAAAGVDRLIHISSLAVLKPGSWSGGILDETTPIDSDNMGRGAYVWGKSKAEEIVSDMSVRLGINARIIRPGPLVDFARFEAPGRLGREVAPYYIVMGSKKSLLSVCDVRTAAIVVRYYLKDFDAVPRVLNLVEPGAMTRQDLTVRLLAQRKDLKALFVPSVFVRAISAVLYAVQKIIKPSDEPISIAAAFSSELYNTELAEKIVTKANSY
jgi:nucleoside-diphosphate-sugar epimerase